MEINVLEKSDNKIIFELIGEGHSFCNSLKKELWNQKATVAAGYTIKHPLVGIPRMVLETDGSKSPEEILSLASTALGKKCDAFKKEFSKLIK